MAETQLGDYMGDMEVPNQPEERNLSTLSMQLTCSIRQIFRIRAMAQCKDHALGHKIKTKQTFFSKE